MNNFGTIKSKIIKKLTEAYSSNNKSEMKMIINLLKENKELKELYLFYEEIESIDLSMAGSAELYLEIVEPLLIERTQQLKDTNKKLNILLSDVEPEKNDLYEYLDILSKKTSLTNLDKKVVARKKLIEHLSTKKNITEPENINHSMNENLLNAVLVNDFNASFGYSLTEDQKLELKTILSMSDDELELKIGDLKESILGKVTSLISESTDVDLKNKLESVHSEVRTIGVTKYGYYQLIQLKEGFDE